MNINELTKICNFIEEKQLIPRNNEAINNNSILSRFVNNNSILSRFVNNKPMISGLIIDKPIIDKSLIDKPIIDKPLIENWWVRGFVIAGVLSLIFVSPKFISKPIKNICTKYLINKNLGFIIKQSYEKKSYFDIFKGSAVIGSFFMSRLFNNFGNTKFHNNIILGEYVIDADFIEKSNKILFDGSIEIFHSNILIFKGETEHNKGELKLIEKHEN